MGMNAERATDIYEKLGVRPVINAQGGVTDLGGSMLTPGVKRAMDEVGKSFVEMRELLEKSGEYIANILGVEAAYITSGAAAALTLSTAACIAGSARKNIERLPDTTAMKNEVVIQKKQRYGFDRCYAYPGGKLVEAGDESGCTPAQLEAAIGPNTAAVAYLVMADGDSSVVSLEDTVELAHDHNVPVIADGAWQIWPLDYFLKTAQSADLVCFGAKYLGAPHSTGIVCGKKDLVDAVAANGFIASVRSFGRPMKVDRQEIVGAAVAVENWFAMDHEKRLKGWEEKFSTIERGLEGIAGVRTERFSHATNYLRVALHVVLDTGVLGKNTEQVARELDSGNPRIAVLFAGMHPLDEGTIEIRAYNLYDGEERVIADRLRGVLGG